MNYQKHHDLLIKKRGKKEKPSDGGYYERHHILPRSLGGNDSDDNLIYLTGREHLIIHWLLYKIHGIGPMADAFYAMCMSANNTRGKPISRIIEIAMRAKTDAHSNRWLKGEIDLSKYTTELANYSGLQSHSQSKEYRESISGLKSPMAKFLFDFYNENGEVVHEGTYATFAKAFDLNYRPVYESFKRNGFYKEWTMGNKRNNPYRTEAPFIDMFDAKTGELELARFKAHEERDYLRETYGIFPAKVSVILKGQQRQTKGYTFKKSV